MAIKEIVISSKSGLTRREAIGESMDRSCSEVTNFSSKNFIKWLNKYGWDIVLAQNDEPSPPNLTPQGEVR